MAAIPSGFEPFGDSFVSRGDIVARISRDRVDWPAAGMAMILESARHASSGEGLDELPGRISYFKGSDPSKWRSGVPRFGRVQFREIYRKTDIIYHNNGRELEFDFVLSAGASPEDVKLRFEGAAVRIGTDGSLEVAGQTKKIRLPAPLAWQDIHGRRKMIRSRFRFLAPNVAGFAVEPFDRRNTLIIDPIVQVATYYGGSGNENDIQLLTDPVGNVYLFGTTDSVDLPQATLPGAPLNQPIELLQSDCFLARMRPDGTTLDYAIYFGGSSAENVVAVARDGLGFLHVLGTTNSPNFPVSPSAWRKTILAASPDLFWAKFDPDSGTLLASTFLGVPSVSTIGNFAAFLAVDSVGDPYIAGALAPSDFKPTPGAYQVTVGQSDAHGFVMRLNSTGSAQIYSTFFTDGFIQSIQSDPVGGLYIGGVAASANPPVLNPLPGTTPASTSSSRGYVFRLNPAGSALTFATPLGTTISRVAIDPSGKVHVIGTATTLGFDPVNSVQLGPAGGAVSPAPYWVIIDPAKANRLVSATLFNDGSPAPTQLAFLPNGSTCMLVSGSSFVQDPGGVVAKNSSGSYYSSGRLTCLNAQGAQYFTTFVPDGLEYPSPPFINISISLAPAPDGGVWVGGTAHFGFATTPGAFQTQFGGGDYNSSQTDAGLIKLLPQNPSPALTDADPPLAIVNTQQSFIFYLNGAGFAFGTQVLWNGAPIASTFIDPRSLSVQVSDPALLQPGTVTLTASLPAPGGGTSNPVQLQLVNPAPSNLFLLPASANSGSASINLQVTGTNLLPSTALSWDGQIRAGKYSASGTPNIQITLSASDLEQPGTHTVTLTNPGPGGGSASAIFTVVGATPPLSVRAGTVPFVWNTSADPMLVPLFATGLSTGATATWDGTPVAATVGSSTQITLAVPAPLVRNQSRHVAVVSVNGQSSQAVVYTAAPLNGANVVAVDAVQRKIYAVSPSFSQDPMLLQIDLDTFQQIASVGIPAKAAYSASSDDMSFLYFISGTNVVYRFNTATLTFDFQFTLDQAIYGYLSSVAVLSGSPDSLVVLTNTSIVFVDHGIPRGNMATLLDGSVIATTTDRIYVGTPFQLRTCFYWLSYDLFGATSPLINSCDPVELGLVQDSMLSYLQIGSRIVPVGFSAGPPLIAGVFPDLAGRRVTVLSPTQGLVDWNLDTFVATPLLSLRAGTAFQINSHRLLLTGGYLFNFDPANP